MFRRPPFRKLYFWSSRISKYLKIILKKGSRDFLDFLSYLGVSHDKHNWFWGSGTSHACREEMLSPYLEQAR